MSSIISDDGAILWRGDYPPLKAAIEVMRQRPHLSFLGATMLVTDTFNFRGGEDTDERLPLKIGPMLWAWMQHVAFEGSNPESQGYCILCVGEQKAKGGPEFAFDLPEFYRRDLMDRFRYNEHPNFCTQFHRPVLEDYFLNFGGKSSLTGDRSEHVNDILDKQGYLLWRGPGSALTALANLFDKKPYLKYEGATLQADSAHNIKSVPPKPFTVTDGLQHFATFAENEIEDLCAHCEKEIDYKRSGEVASKVRQTRNWQNTTVPHNIDLIDKIHTHFCSKCVTTAVWLLAPRFYELANAKRIH